MLKILLATKKFFLLRLATKILRRIKMKRQLKLFALLH